MKRTAFGLAAALAFAAVFAAAPAQAREAVVFVEAHPDDLAGSLGTAMLLAEKYDVHVVDFTHGELGLGKPGLEDGSTKKLRTAEETAVCAGAGLRLHWCDQVDGSAYADAAACEQLRALFAAVRPRAVFCHWPVDVHADHVMSAAATLKALKLAGLDPEIYFHEQDSQSRGFPRAYHVDVSSVLDRKNELVAKYVCQQGGEIAKRKTASQAAYGRNAGLPSAEVFGVMSGTVRPGKCVFDAIDGVRQ